MPMLHLLDAAGPAACPATLAQIQACRSGDAAGKVVLFGGAPLRRMAALAGLKVDVAMAPPLGKPWLAPSAGGCLLASFNPTAITAWSVDALLLAHLRLPRVPATLMLLQAPTPRELRLLACLQRWRPFALQAPQALLAGGALDAARARLDVKGVTLPMVGALPVPPAQPPATLPAFLLLGARANAWQGASAVGILEVMQGTPPHTPPRHHLCLLPDQPGLAHARRLTSNLGQPERLVPDARAAYPWIDAPDCRAVLALTSPDGPDATQTVFLPYFAVNKTPLVVADVPALRALVESGNPHGGRIHWARADDLPAMAHALSQS